MADTTPPAKTTPAKTTAKPAPDEKPAKARASMTEQTVALGTEVRQAAQDIKEQLNELLAKAVALITEGTPAASDSPYIGTGVQRLRVAVDDMHRWVDSLSSAGADLERVTETPAAP